MKISVTETVNKEIEVELPLFFESGNSFVKIISEDTYIQVELNGSLVNFGISETKSKLLVDHFITKAKPSDETAFNDALLNAKASISLL